MPAPIYVISGVPGSGKTSVARALCESQPASLLVSGDDLRAMVVTGNASPLDGWSRETQLQFDLSHRTMAGMAARYADAGFLVVIDDVLREDDLRRLFYADLGQRRLRRVLLKPSLATVLARNRDRTNKNFDTGRLAPIIRRLYDSLAADTSGWMVIDTTSLSAAETVTRIVEAFPDSTPAQVRKY